MDVNKAKQPNMVSTLISQKPQGSTSNMRSPSARTESNSENLALNTRSRIPRENGFGDFCFGRMTMRDYHKEETFSYCRPSDVWKKWERWSEEELLVGSGNKPHAELDDFQRQGVFPYFKLPFEIRTRILRLLLAPFFKTDQITQTNLIKMSLLVSNSPLSWLRDAYSGDFQQFVNALPVCVLKRSPKLGYQEAQRLRKEFTRRFGHFTNLTTAYRRKYDAIFSVAKKGFRFEDQEHPARSNQYITNTINFTKQQPHPGTPGRDWHMIKLVRDLSNISCQFRQELGEIMWQNTRMDFINGIFSGKPMAFLIDRPAIHKGIKSLAFDIGIINDTAEDINTLKQFCRYVAAVLELTHLEIRLQATYTELTAVARGEWPGIELVRSLSVTKSFVARCPFYIDNEDLSPKIQAILMPNSLRSPKPKQDLPSTDEKTVYLQSRLLEY